MQINIPIKAILFDLDDTLLDGRKAQNNAIKEFSELFPELKKIETAELTEDWREITFKYYDSYQKGIITFEESRIRRMRELFAIVGIHISKKDAKERFEIYKKLYEKNWTAFDDAIEVLEVLRKKYNLGLVTNGDSKQQREKIEKIGVAKYFDQVTISDEVGFAKPDNRIFEITCNKLQVRPEECIMIGDKFKVDVEGGIKAGMTSIWVNRKNEKINYNLQIKQLKELIKIIK